MNEGVYSGEWYYRNIKYQKLLVMVIARSQRGQFLTAYKVGIVSMESFASVSVCIKANEKIGNLGTMATDQIHYDICFGFCR